MMNLENMLKSEDFTLLIKFRTVKTWSSQWSHTVMRAGPSRRQGAEELMPSNCGTEEDS